ncbi:hypothetical protein FS749_015349 [Ceratobasidium sp. UAMH 11750]|nr:hypothetical protein FS749_015349 [Ceratobasidium sp. UAMH 11750]
MTSQRVRTLLEWCDAQGIILSNIELVDHDVDKLSFDQSGISVVARGNLTHSDIVAKIPKPAVLSRKSSQLLAKTNVDTTGDDVMELALVLAYEIAIGEQSRWFGYLQSLPREVPVAALWEDNDDQDSRLAFLWLQDTETKQVTDPPGANSSISQNILTYFRQTASPILTSLGCDITLSDFRRAWSLVSSRSFRVDAYHGLAMLPIADAFNHIGENQVHIETDFDVCPICGALQSCPHDQDENDATLGSGPPEDAPLNLEDTCDMVINAPVGAGDEIFNTYDANLPNSVLLARYGFILEGNECDYLSWDSTTLRMQTTCGEDLARVWTGDLLAGTSLVYDPTEFSATLPLHASPSGHNRSAAQTPQYKLNADGLVSVDLWVLVAVRAVNATNARRADTGLRSRLEQLATAQVYAESREPHGPGISDTMQELGLIADLIQDMCKSRLLGMYRPELSPAECGNLLDDLPDSMIRSRLAISQALSERATLSACIDVWRELTEYIEQVQTCDTN